MDKPRKKKVSREPVKHKSADSSSFKLPKQGPSAALEWPMRLNKYIAAAGVCARRAAAELVKAGKVSVNGAVVLEPGVLVEATDKVAYNGKVIRPSENFMYILLNKPKNYLTTTSDDRGRLSVLDLIREAGRERLFPVGRLDRNTTGLLLITNDGELAQRLSHPSNNIRKTYFVELDKPVTDKDMKAIADGLTLEDGPVEVDGLAWPDAARRNEVLVELHSGRNRIIRRMFEHLGYEVYNLDRTGYAGLDKKNLPRGRYRHLTDREIIMLRHFIGRKKGLDPAKKDERPKQ